MLEIFFEKYLNKISTNWFFIINIIIMQLFYSTIRIYLRKKYKLNLPIVLKRMPDTPILSLIPPAIYTIGLVFSLFLQVIIAYILTYFNII